MNLNQIMSAVRWACSAIGGYLMGKGIWNSTNAANFTQAVEYLATNGPAIVGALTTIAPLIWSIYTHRTAGLSRDPAVKAVQAVTGPSVPKVSLIILAALVGMWAFMPASARAASRPLTGDPIADIKALNTKVATDTGITLQTPDQIVDKVRDWATSAGGADLEAATKLATAANDNVTLPCWNAIYSVVKQIQTLPTADQLPKLHLAVDIEIATLLTIALQPNSPVITSCSALANFQKMAAVNMVTGIVTGALSLSKLAPIIP